MGNFDEPQWGISASAVSRVNSDPSGPSHYRNFWPAAVARADRLKLKRSARNYLGVWFHSQVVVVISS